MKAVISADIIGYSKLAPQRADEVLDGLKQFLKEQKEINTANNLSPDFKIKRGDALQIVLSDASDALGLALMLKATVTQIAFTDDNKRRHPDIDIRMAIGLGAIENQKIKVDESTGEAFIYSGRTLDTMKREKRTFAIKTPNHDWNRELDTAFQLLEVILSGWNITSAELVYLLLKGLNETQIAEQLNISQPAVNQRKKRAGWTGIEALLIRYKEITNPINS
ncbi:MAG: helix-turn-helix domain-containing protein [Weeksellaceae bacterium]